MPLDTGRRRLDKWLWYARVTKSRTLAQKLVNGGHVRVNRDKITNASYQIKIDDVLTIALERRILILRVLDPGTRRGPATEARTLYEDLSPPPLPRAEKPPETAKRAPGSGRPTKKERRQTDQFRQGEPD